MDRVSTARQSVFGCWEDGWLWSEVVEIDSELCAAEVEGRVGSVVDVGKGQAQCHKQPGLLKVQESWTEDQSHQ